MTIEEIAKARSDIEATADLLERANLRRLGLDAPSCRKTDYGTSGLRLRRAFDGARVPAFGCEQGERVER